MNQINEPLRSKKTHSPPLYSKAEKLADAPLFMLRMYEQMEYNPDTALSKLHMHDFVEISVVMSGRGIHCTLDGCVECQKGDVYIINTMVPHSYFANRDGECATVFNFVFDPTDFLDGEPADPNHPRFCYGIFRENPSVAFTSLNSCMLEEVEHIASHMDLELKNRDFEWEGAIKGELIKLLVMMSRSVSKQNINVVNYHAKERSLMLLVLRAVMERYDDPNLTLEQIAKEICISMSHLSRIFHRVTGEKFSNYLRRIRIEQACRLLVETDLSNEQIVYACGLRDVPSFYRLFKAQIGCTPYVYRQGEHSAEQNKNTLK